MKSTHLSEYRHFLAELRGVRKKAGISQQDLANRLKRPQSFVSKYEMGERRLDMVEFIEVVSALEGDPVKFLSKFMKAIQPVSVWKTLKTRGRKRSPRKAY